MAALSSFVEASLNSYRQSTLAFLESNTLHELTEQPVHPLEKIYHAFLTGKTAPSFPFMLPFSEKLEAAIVLLAHDNEHLDAKAFLTACIHPFGVKHQGRLSETIDSALLMRISTGSPAECISEQVMSQLFQAYDLRMCIDEESKGVSYTHSGRNVPLFVTRCQGIELIGAPSSFPLLTDETFGVTQDSTTDGVAPLYFKNTVSYMHWNKDFSDERFRFDCTFVSEEGQLPLAFIFLVKADMVEVDDYGVVSKASLDKYHGPMTHLFLTSGDSVLRIDAKGGCEMQVIPLAGGSVFYGADFLLAYVVGDRGEYVRIEGRGIQ